MNLAQRIVLIVGFLLVLGMALFPPWLYVYKFPRFPQTERPAGYFLIFEQHTPQDRAALASLFGITDPDYTGTQFFSLEIDRTRLEVQIGAAIVLIAILTVAVRTSPKRIDH